MLAILQLARPKQWIKNIIVFAPLIFAGLMTHPSAVIQACLAFFFFCITASMVYIVNDIHDKEDDARHPIKSKKRPLASGAVSLKQAYQLLGGLALILCLGFFQSVPLMLCLIAYLALNLSYTFYFKSKPVIELFIIALGFVIRIFAGAVAIDVHVSGWMFITTLALALYLASIKRRQELITTEGHSREVLADYTPALLNRYAEMSATGAIVFYSLFVIEARPELVGTIPIVLFGIFRYWFLVENKQAGESPTDVFYSDLQLIATVVLWTLFCLWGIMYA